MEPTKSPSCYEFVLYDTGAGGLSPSFANPIDATYVVYLEGNQERYDQVMDQLKQIRPTEQIWIVHNKGYKKCHKGDHIQSPPQDIVDVNYEIFKHANQEGYQSILVLEDDFLFDERLLPTDPNSGRIAKEIGHFIKSWGDETPLLYYLGTLPLIQCPWGLSPHNIVFLSAANHAPIYNRAFRDMILSVNSTQIKDLDVYIQEYPGLRFSYSVPLCYQIFTYTENSGYWGYQDSLVHVFSKKFHDVNSWLFDLDKKIEPGYSFYYLFSKVLFFILIVFFGFLIWKILRGVYLSISWLLLSLIGWRGNKRAKSNLRRGSSNVRTN